MFKIPEVTIWKNLHTKIFLLKHAKFQNILTLEGQ